MKRYCVLVVLLSNLMICNYSLSVEKEESQKKDSDTSQKNDREKERSFLDKIVESVAEHSINNPDYGKDITDR